MANSETVDLMSIGAHCSVESCRQKDFLPFTCAACRGTFCLEHRTHSAHQCPAGPSVATEGQAIVCPVCAHAIKLRPGQDGNEAFEAHARSGTCDPSNYARVHRKQRCPVSGCREKMTTLNRYRCKKCGLEVCMSHRLPGDHGCDERIAAEAARKTVRSRWSGVPTSSAVPTRSPASLPAAPASAMTATASTWHSTVADWLSSAAQQIQGGQKQKREVCQHCRGRFSSAQQLSSHIREYHPVRSWRRHQDACPRCGQQFTDAVALVAHVEGKCRS